jgi:integrase
MRRRYQAGSVTRSGDGRYWLGKYRAEDGKQKCKLLGKVRELSKSAAKDKLATIMRPVNAAVEGVGPTVNDFLKDTFFPRFTRKWKQSTLATNQERIQREIGGKFGKCLLAGLTRDDLQEFLDSKSSKSFSTVGHIRWDLKQMLDLAMSEGLITKNPALMLFIPKSCSKPKRVVMTLDDVRRAINGLQLQERLVFKLATVAGLRPGEIFGLRRGRILDQVVEIQERVYRGAMDTPKTDRSVRSVTLASMLREDMQAWLEKTPGGSDAWLFPSERLTTPVSKDNFMYRSLRPALLSVGLGWVNFQVMRRTHASLMRGLGVDPKIVADLLGHDLSTDLNVYTQTSIQARMEAAETLGSALVN